MSGIIAVSTATPDANDSPPVIVGIDDPTLRTALRQKIDQLTKPLGALGQLEALALQIGLIQQTTAPALHAPQIVVFAADHGVADEGVSAYPQAVTAQMVANFLAGGAAINVFARQHGLALTVVDAGIAADIPLQAGLVSRRIGAGTRNFVHEPAMTDAQCRAALDAGRELLAGLPGNVVGFGEMGIANTTAAAALIARLADLPAAACVGRGTGIDDARLAHKRTVVERALARHAAATTPFAALAALGGFEIAMMTGAMLAAASERRVLLIDGIISSAACLVAARMAPRLLDYCVFAHCSQEVGHRLLLAQLGVRPLLDLDLRLGEGTGAALVWPLLQSSLAMLQQMASFASAGVSTREG